MKLLLVMLTLILCSCTSRPKIEKLCLDKDPNEMTERELEVCKVYLQPSIIVKS